MEAHDRHQPPSVPGKGIARWPGTAVAMGRAAESVLHNLKFSPLSSVDVVFYLLEHFC